MLGNRPDELGAAPSPLEPGAEAPGDVGKPLIVTAHRYHRASAVRAVGNEGVLVVIHIRRERD
jgi:hypothetical protein